MSKKYPTKEEVNQLAKSKKSFVKYPTKAQVNQLGKTVKAKKTTQKEVKSTAEKVKSGVKKQVDWLIRDIKSDFLPTEERQKVQNQIAKEKKADYEKKGGFANDKVGQFYTGLGEGVVNNSLPGAAYSIAKGKKLSDSKLMTKGKTTIKPPTKEASKARKAGNVAGEMLGYATGYGAAEKATTKLAGKALATKAGKKVTEKAVASKAGKKIGEEATKQAVKSAAKNIAADATVGTALDLGLARGEGKTGKDLAKDMAINAAINAATGGVMEALPVIKSLKGAKQTAKKELPKAVNAVENTQVKPKAELPKKGTKQAENVKIEPKGDYIDYVMSEAEKMPPRKSVSSVRTTKLPTKQSSKQKFDSKIGGFDTWGDSKAVKETLKSVNDKIAKNTLTDDDKWQAAYTLAENAMSVSKYVPEDVKNLQKVLRNTPISLNENTKLGLADGYADLRKKSFGSLKLSKDGKDIDEVYYTLRSEFPGILKKADTQEEQLAELYRISKQRPEYTPAYNEIPAEELVQGFYKNINDNISSIPIDYRGKLNKPAPPIRKAAEEIEVTPSGSEKIGGFEVAGKQNLGIINPDVKTIQDAMEDATGKFHKFYSASVNSQHEIDRLAKESGNRKVADSVQAVRTSSGTAEYIYTKNLVNPKGEVISDKSFYDVFKPVSKNSKDFNTYAQHLNNIDRWKQGKPVFEQYSADESQKIVDEMLRKHPEFAQITQDINEYWRKFTHAWLVDTGRMSEDAWQAMNKMYPNYVPAFRKNKAGGVSVGGSHYSIGSGVKKAKGGHSETIPIEDAMMEQVQQMVKTTRKNDLYLNLIDTLKSDPEQLKTFGVVVDKKPMQSLDIDDFMTETEQNALKQINSKLYTISAMENGQKVTAYINKDIADALGKLDNVVGSDYMRAFMKAGKTITNPLKAGITGYNPIFAVSNMARDIPTAIIQSEYGVATTTKNMFNAIYQMATNGEMWQRYQALGGKSAGYINAHRGFERSFNMSKNPIRNVWEGMKTVLGAFGEATESIPRLAEFISSMEKHGDLNRALNEAAEVTVNFSRAGEVTKVLDGWTLYLNAAVQGIDKFVRTAKAHPARTAARSIGVVGVPYALLMAANWNNPHYQDLNERTKQNYFCIPNLLGEFDEEGNPKTFIKIPLNREYGTIFASSLDVVADYMSGKADPFKGYGETIKNNFLPPNPLTDNVLAPLLINLPQNKDFAGRSIVPTSLENVSPQLQYDYSTSGLAKGIANVANNLNLPSETLKSPMKVDYLLDSFGGYLGEVGQAVTDPQLQGLKERAKGATIDPFINRFTADPRFSSGVVSDFYDDKEKAEREYNDEKILTGEKGEAYIKNKTYNAIQKELSDLSKQEREILSSNLSKAEKDIQIKGIREQKNEIARYAGQRAEDAASDYRANPNYTLLDAQQKKSYEEKYAPLGIKKEEYAEAKRITQGKDRNIEQAYALLDNGQSEKIATAMTSERAVQRATWLKQAGVTPEKLDQVASAIDVNGNGSYSKDEIIYYFNQNGGYSTAQKRAIFLALSTAKNSPY